jgi:Raf kinase inhibitor-like YbhB/YbcL family protein
LKLSSPAFDNGEPIPARYTCDGENVSPELQWSDMPAGTVSLALTCQDPDAPRGVFTHWLMWDLAPEREGLEAGEVPPEAKQGVNDFGNVGYDGPCPPPGHGVHHYRFVLYAVSRRLVLLDGATIAELRAPLEGATLARSELVGTYER